MFNVKKVKPLFTGVITTATVYKMDQTSSASGILYDVSKRKGDINLFQRVVSAGPMASGIKEGDIVRINLKRYAKASHVPGKKEENIIKDNYSVVYEIPSIDINGIRHLFLQNNDIEYIVEEYDIDDGGLLE